MLRWKRRRAECERPRKELPQRNSPPNPVTTARSVRIAISAPQPRRPLSFPRKRLPPARIEVGNAIDEVIDLSPKNFGDAHRVPVRCLCCRFLVLLCFLLRFLLGCHGSILPFHSSWMFATVLLSQLIDCIESSLNE